MGVAIVGPYTILRSRTVSVIHPYGEFCTVERRLSDYGGHGGGKRAKCLGQPGILIGRVAEKETPENDRQADGDFGKGSQDGSQLVFEGQVRIGDPDHGMILGYTSPGREEPEGGSLCAVFQVGHQSQCCVILQK